MGFHFYVFDLGYVRLISHYDGINLSPKFYIKNKKNKKKVLKNICFLSKRVKKWRKRRKFSYYKKYKFTPKSEPYKQHNKAPKQALVAMKAASFWKIKPVAARLPQSQSSPKYQMPKVAHHLRAADE